MSTKYILIFAFLSLIIFSSCRKEINGSGRFITEHRATSSFSEIESDGDFHVVVIQDSVIDLEVYGDDNIIPYIETRVSGNKLRIYYSNHFKRYDHSGITITIHVPLLTSASLHGSGRIRSDGPLTADSFTGLLSGSGNIDLSLHSTEITTILSGSGTIRLHGSTVNSRHTLSGSGTTDASDMTARTATVFLSGSGECRVAVSEVLNATISGSGNIYYTGTPNISSSISGSGHISRY